MENAIEQFIIFCLESYKMKKEINGAQAYHDFERYDVFSYLKEGYEVLHTQSQDYLIADTEDYINHKQASKKNRGR